MTFPEPATYTAKAREIKAQGQRPERLDTVLQWAERQGMSMIATESVIIEKTRELCETILNAPEYRSVRQNVDSFMENEKAREHYQRVVEKGDSLNHKQQNGQQLTPAEIADFENDRDSLLNNPVASNFINAQEEMHKIQDSVVKYVKKTIELGRLPNEDEMGGGGCGSGCGCH